MSSTPSNVNDGHELADLFERGAVFADRWPTAVRHRLNVPDPLTRPLQEALLIRALVSRHIIRGCSGGRARRRSRGWWRAASAVDAGS